jgi:hypothetical protein
MEEDQPKTVNRRRLLRRAGTVAAGLGAAGVASAVAAAPASANPGDNVVAGQTVDAGSFSTGITSNSAPTLVLKSAGGPQLQLVPDATDLEGSAAPLGSLLSTTKGELQYQSQGSNGGGVPSLVYTSYTATQTWAVNPFRVLDTRGLGGVFPVGNTVMNGSGRTLIVDLSVLNSEGKLIGGKSLLLNLTGLVKLGWGLFVNVTTQAPEQNGYLTVFPAGAELHAASSVNFLTGWPASNCVPVALGDIGTNFTDALQIYSPNTTHVIMDVMAFIVPTVDHINPALRPAGTPGAQPSTGGTGVPDRAARVRASRPQW